MESAEVPGGSQSSERGTGEERAGEGTEEPYRLDEDPHSQALLHPLQGPLNCMTWGGAGGGRDTRSPL